VGDRRPSRPGIITGPGANPANAQHYAASPSRHAGRPRQGAAPAPLPPPGHAIDFSRKLAVRSLGDPTRAQVEAYIRDQVPNAALADERLREMLPSFTVVNPHVNLSQPSESTSGLYWYNLHLVLVVRERYRIGEVPTLAKIRDTAFRICAKKT
jgi:hypothetical protein